VVRQLTGKIIKSKILPLMACATYLLSIILVITAANTVQATGVTATIKVGSQSGGGSQPDGIAYDSGKGEIFVANHADNTVSIISDSSNTVVATVAVGNAPNSVVYDSGKGEVFVSNYGSNTVSVISDSDNKVVATVPVGDGPGSMAYDSGKGEIFVTSSRSGVSVISDSSNTVVATVPVQNPYSIAYDFKTGEIFVLNIDDATGNNTFCVISDTGNNVVASGNLCEGWDIFEAGPVGAVYDSGKNEFFVNSCDNAVSIISDSGYQVVASIPMGNISKGEGFCQGGSYNPAKGEIYVANLNADTLSVISDSTNKVVATIPVGSGPRGVVYDSGKNEIFVSNCFDNSVSVIPETSIQYVTGPGEGLSFSTLMVIAGAVIVSIALLVIYRKQSKKRKE
jgi:YVTN family beta-propeller protein